MRQPKDPKEAHPAELRAEDPDLKVASSQEPSFEKDSMLGRR